MSEEAVKVVYVTWNPLHEKVVCVHSNQDEWCDDCEAASKLLEDTTYFLEVDCFEGT